MTFAEYFHYQRILDHYTEEASRARAISIWMLIMATASFITGIVMTIVMKEIIALLLWFIPTFAFSCISLAATADAVECENMIIHIKNKMW